MFGHHNDESTKDVSTQNDNHGISEEPHSDAVSFSAGATDDQAQATATAVPVSSDTAFAEEENLIKPEPASFSDANTATTEPPAPDNMPDLPAPAIVPDISHQPEITAQATPEPAAPAAAEPWQHPGAPLSDAPSDAPEEDEKAPEPIADVISPAGGFPKPMSFRKEDKDDEEPFVVPPISPITIQDDDAKDTDTDSKTHELIDIKQKVLSELSPLIDELDLPPADKFRTIMMMIQASDDQSLVKAAYESAHAIEDEKARAQALLDIVNEINYFTQPHDS